MLFVMLIVSLLVGLTAPRFGTGIEQYEERSQYEHIEDQLRQLPRRARLAARGLELPKDQQLTNLGDGEPPLNLPPGWTITFSPPLVISRLGACSGTTVTISPSARNTASSRLYKISEFSCELSPQNP